MTSVDAEIVQLLVSPRQRYVGRPADGPLPAEVQEIIDAIEIRAGKGIVGDRYFGKRAHANAAVTLMAQESLAGLPAGVDLVQTRRNVLLRGFDVDARIGSTIALDSGDGPVQLRLHRPSNPCGWMDTVIGPGSRKALRGKGGARCEPVTSGWLRVGPVRIDVLG